jgi:hypothetical protein
VPSFLVDENLPGRLAQELSARGFPSQHVADIPELRSAADERVLEGQGVLLVTRFPEAAATGVVSVRLRDRMPIDEQVRIVVTAISSIDASEFPGSVIVVEPGRLRVRRRKA